MRGNARKLRMVYARREIEWHIFTRHKEILVVDGECGLVAVVSSFVLSYHHPAQQKHDVSSNVFIVVSPFQWTGTGGFPVLWEERTVRGNLQGVFDHGGRRGHGGNHR